MDEGSSIIYIHYLPLCGSTFIYFYIPFTIYTETPQQFTV